MGSHVQAWSSGQPWRVWSLWGWAAARLGTDWTARFFQGDEETLVLTQRDELSRTYAEDNVLPLNTVTPVNMANSQDTRSTTASATEDKHVLVRMQELGIGDSGAARTSTSEKVLVQLEKLTATTVGDRPSPGEDRFTSIFDQENPPSTEGVTDGTSNGPGTSTTSSVVSLQHPAGPDETRSNSEGTPPSAEVHPMQRRGSSLAHNEDKAMPDVNQTNKKKTSYRRAGEVRESKRYRADRDHTENKKVRRSRTSQVNPGSLAPRLSSCEERAAKEERGLDGSSILFTDPHEEGPPPRCDSETSPIPTLSTWEAGWNVTNAIQGIFVLGLPYALVHSGYVGLLVLVLSAWICNHTGQLLVSCLYEEYSVGSGQVLRVRVRHSYQDIAEACYPKWAGLGGWLMNVAQIIELLMTCTLYLLVSSSLLWDSLSGMAVPRSVCSLLTLACVLPCLLLPDLRPVSTLSLLCSLAHIVISVLVMLYCVSQASRWSLSGLSVSDVDPEDFVVSVGVIVFSYTSQIFLPPIEGSMADRGQFSSMLQWTHAAACVMKTTFALLAVLTWGQGTGEVITDNLPSDLRPLVNLCLLAKALMSYPLPFYSAAEILHTCLLTGPSVPSRPTRIGGAVSYAGLVLRGALLVASFLLALLVPRFSLLMGLTGSVTGAAMALTLPCLFHLQLRWSRLSSKDRVKDVAILSLGLSCSVSGLICSVKRLLEGL